jgi:hypothetical protein
LPKYLTISGARLFYCLIINPKQTMKGEILMKKFAVCLAVAAALPALPAFAANVGVSVGINIGTPPAVVVPAPPPPVYHAPPVVIEEPPLFIEPPELGFHVAVGIPHDIFFIGSTYYLYRGNAWYRAPHYNGPWVSTRYKALPHKLRRHSHEKIRHYREAGYRDYRNGHRPYWERHHFRPGKDWKRAEKAHRKIEKREWNAERHDMKRHRHDKRGMNTHGGPHGHGG